MIVVESCLSVIHLYAAGFPAVALLGRSLSQAQHSLLKSCPNLRAVTVLLDGDAPG